MIVSAGKNLLRDSWWTRRNINGIVTGSPGTSGYTKTSGHLEVDKPNTIIIEHLCRNRIYVDCPEIDQW